MCSKTMAKGKQGKKLYALIFIIIVIDCAFTFWILYPTFFHPPIPIPKYLKIITRYDTTIWSYFGDAFLQSPQAEELDITGIEFIGATEPQWVDFIHSPAGAPDIAWGGSTTLFDQLYDAGLLMKLTSPQMQSVLSQVNETIANAGMIHYDDDGDPIWVASTMSSYGFIINKEWLSSRGLPFPTHWENLSNPEYGQFLPDTPTIIIGWNSYAEITGIIEFILQKFDWVKGWEILVRMAGNAEYTTMLYSLDLHDAGIQITDVYRSFQIIAQLQDLDLEFKIPADGTIAKGNPVAICSTTQNQDAAEAFIDFILSPEGQKQWLHQDINQIPIQESAFNTDIRSNRTDLYNYYKQTVNNLINFNYTLAHSYEYSINYYY